MNGNNIIVYWNGTAIAAVKSNSIKAKADTIETASPTNGEWKTHITSRKEWQISVSYLILTDSGVRDLLKMGNSYTIKVKGRNAADSAGVTGTATLTNCDITATRGNLVTGSFQFVGNGPLQ